MPAKICPYCEYKTNFSILWSTNELPRGSPWPGGENTVYGLFKCQNETCGMAVIGITYRDSFQLTWPETVGGKQFPDVPTHIAEAADEAYRTFSIQAYRAAVLLARAVVEATAKAKGIKNGQLYDKIEAMSKAGLIRDYVKEAAHEVRHLGNDMAHGDFVDPVDEEDAKLVLTLMDEVLDEVFQAPAKVAAAQAARLARQQATAP